MGNVITRNHALDVKYQYYENGTEHLAFLDFDDWIYDQGDEIRNGYIANFAFNSKLDKPYKNPCSYSPEPIETVAGFVYAGERIPISHNKELWKYSVTIVWRGMKTFRKKPNN